MSNPTTSQSENLKRMQGVLHSNAKAYELAEKLWRFYGFRLACFVQPDDGFPSRYRVHMNDYEKTRIPADVAPIIWLKQTPRIEEALVHELLHLELVAEGFPRIWVLEPVTREQSDLAAGVQNLADHVVMLPRFISLGYGQSKFLGPSNLSAYEAQVLADVIRLPNLDTPEGYRDSVFKYLQGRVNFRFSNVIFSQT